MATYVCADINDYGCCGEWWSCREVKMSIKLKWIELNGECNLKEAPVAADFNGG